MQDQEHFLVVEDDPLIGRAVKLAADGILDAQWAETGEDALAALAGPDLPRFVLLDFGLPDMDGLDIVRRVRADPRCRLLPVVMFSSLQDPTRIATTLQAGADAWVFKPNEPEELRAIVRNLCRTWGLPRSDASAK